MHEITVQSDGFIYKLRFCFATSATSPRRHLALTAEGLGKGGTGCCREGGPGRHDRPDFRVIAVVSKREGPVYIRSIGDCMIDVTADLTSCC